MGQAGGKAPDSQSEKLSLNTPVFFMRLSHASESYFSHLLNGHIDTSVLPLDFW